MHLNEVAEGLEPLDLSQSAEFQSLLQSARELGIPHSANVRYVSRNTVVRHERLHFLEWGDPSAPPVLLLHGVNQTSHAWDLVSLHLADRYHVYAIDQRGHGDSEWVKDGAYDFRDYADDAKALANRGNAYDDMGRASDALADYTAALVIAPNDAIVHRNRGATLSRLGNTDGAFEEFQRALAASPGRARSLLGLATAATAAGDIAIARDAVRQLRAIWHGADTTLPELAELARLEASLPQ